MSRIELTNVSKHFAEKYALTDISLTVESGIFGLLGSNGAGKTTMLRLILGLLTPTRGEVRVNGLDPKKNGNQLRRQVAVLLEDYGFYERLNARENLTFFGKAQGLQGGDLDNEITKILDMLPAKSLQNPVGTWSKGMKQKLAIGRTLMGDPKIVFWDEPSSGLDPVEAHELRQQMQAIAKRKQTTIFLITHLLADVEQLCDAIGVLHQGSLLTVDSPSHLRKRFQSKQVEIAGDGITIDHQQALARWVGIEVTPLNKTDIVLSVTDEGQISEVVRFLVEHGVAILAVIPKEQTLTDVFLQLIPGREKER